MNSESSLPDLVRMFDDVLPLASDQQFVFQQLIDSVAYCVQLGSAAWSVTLTSWGFRLNVGQVEVMTCEFRYSGAVEFALPDDAWFVHLRVFLAGEDVLSRIALDAEVEAIDEGAYASVGGRHWCYTRFFQAAKSKDDSCDPGRDRFEAQLRSLRSNRDAYLDLACRTSTGKLRQKSNFARSHCPALYELAQMVTAAGTETAGDRALCATPEQSGALDGSQGRVDEEQVRAGVELSARTITNLPAANAAAKTRQEGVEPGFVYLLTNRSMPGLVKIGHTTREIGTRVRELNAPTGIPTPFDVILDVFVRDSAKAEHLAHEQLASHRISTNREFFQVPTSTAIQAIYRAVQEVNEEKNL